MNELWWKEFYAILGEIKQLHDETGGRLRQSEDGEAYQIVSRILERINHDPR